MHPLTHGIIASSGAVFSPDDISNLELWLDAEQGVFSDAGSTLAGDNDSVQEWHDQSGNNRDATNSTGATQPIYKTGVLNSKPVVRFNEDFLYSSSWVTASQPNTVIAVFSTNGLVAEELQSRVFDNQYSGGNSGGNLVFMEDNSGGELMIFAGSRLTRSVSFPLSHLILTGVYDGSNSIIRQDGSESTGDSGSRNTQTSYTLGGSSRDDSEPDRFWLDGDVAEVLFYSKELTSTEIGNVESYLANKYGITLA